MHPQTNSLDPQTKWCGSCKQRVSLSGFTIQRDSGDGLRAHCRECNRRYSANRYRRMTMRDRRDETLRSAYGLSHDDYDELFASQGGVCAICRREGEGFLDVDHDHETGEVRGLLCRRCNRGLGCFGDTAEGLTNALNYLSESR